MTWIIAIIMGGIIGWLASIVMRTDAQQGILLNIVVGIVGAFIGGLIFSGGSINGQSVRFVVDTGASVVAIGRADAERMGLKLQGATPVPMSTANGVVTGYALTLNSVRVQDVEIYSVDAVVMPMPMPNVLLGNSFLSRFQMKRDNDKLTLDRRF